MGKTNGVSRPERKQKLFGTPLSLRMIWRGCLRGSQSGGEWLDSSIGLYYLRARYLNQATGRFWARDPVEGKKCCGLSWNPYIYVKQNPVNTVDPTGRDAPGYLYQLEVDLELRAPLKLQMRATQYVINKVIACVDLLNEYYAVAGIDVLFEACLEDVGP